VESAGVPIQLGGGLRTAADLGAAFDWGVRWAILGTKALQDSAFVRDAAACHRGRIVLGIDAKDGFAATDGWLNVSRVKAVDLARQLADTNLAAIVYTDIATDGMMSGPNLAALKAMRAAVQTPIIASGGICTQEHVRQLMEAGLTGCIIGRALYEGSLELPTLLNLTRTAAERERRLL
jgi:phosphoribosylformimino-5-aminoimidazole carboxamide ribotide isomerase